ncbi:NUDIX hydrolase [Rhodococcus artemisiae]|uniref:NUDIX domain-containing protein n=1 Tax=Rhodococcus artemisiae TaxID=714159 RepID=A0ABU7L411_9NOCA|nr:NUDIX domain-containing protein [Rhodococcus artemisiae]MEE2056291.1 NUDIX domain-containing protein [Rhodococcus artemisiae]
MTLSALTIFVLALIAAVVLLLGLWAYGTANRLDRLHVRSDLSWHALDAALARRAVVVRSIAASTSASDGRRLSVLADRAERADRAQRETAENELSVALAGLDVERLRPQLVAELADAEARVLIARRFHNDAVRDTLALRTRRPVRWLHLGGTAPLPTYFEIAEREVDKAVAVERYETVDNAGVGPSQAPTPDRARTSARVVLLDDTGRVLLLRGHDPARPEVRFWFTVGGAVEPGEDLRVAAVRELAEETGHVVAAAQLVGPVWRRVAVFPFNGEVLHSEELFFVLQTPGFEPGPEGFTELEHRMGLEFRWFDTEGLRALVASGEPLYPQDLPELLDEARRIAGTHEETAANTPLRAIR